MVRPPEPGQRGPREPAAARPVVVIADDDPGMRRLLLATLQSDQYHVLAAEDGATAWQLIHQQRPTTVVLDWQMPEPSGIELAAVIKGDPLLAATTVILLTARSTGEDRAWGEQAHVDHYVTKPFSPFALREIVEQALGVI